MDLRKAWVNLPPQRKRAAVMAGIVIAVLGISYILTSSSSSERKRSHQKAEIRNVLTDTDTREVGIDAISAQIKRLERQQYELSKRMDRLINKQERDAAAIAQANKMASILEKISSRLDSLEDRFATREAEIELLKSRTPDMMTQSDQPVPVEGTKGKNGSKPSDVEKPHQQASDRSGSEVAPNYFQVAPLPGEETHGKTPNHRAGRNGESIAPDLAPRNQNKQSKISEKPPGIRIIQASKPSDSSTPQANKEVAYLPSGSIISGVLINGMDAPTGKNARKNPFPSVLRIQAEAILPNYHKMDIRECFALVSGYGDLSSERAYLRAESISCVRDDGSVLESSLSAYAVGEDGKVGVRGRLVSKQGQIIAKSLMAGFLSGVSQAFNMQPVPAINTNPGDSVSYQSLLTPETLQSGVATGASKALDRIAQYYLDMAENIFPVVEVDAGRKVELLVSKGSRITLRTVKGPDAKNAKKGSKWRQNGT